MNRSVVLSFVVVVAAVLLAVADADVPKEVAFDGSGFGGQFITLEKTDYNLKETVKGQQVVLDEAEKVKVAELRDEVKEETKSTDEVIKDYEQTIHNKEKYFNQIVSELKDLIKQFHNYHEKIVSDHLNKVQVLTSEKSDLEKQTTSYLAEKTSTLEMVHSLKKKVAAQELVIHEAEELKKAAEQQVKAVEEKAEAERKRVDKAITEYEQTILDKDKNLDETVSTLKDLIKQFYNYHEKIVTNHTDKIEVLTGENYNLEKDNDTLQATISLYIEEKLSTLKMVDNLKKIVEAQKVVINQAENLKNVAELQVVDAEKKAEEDRRRVDKAIKDYVQTILELQLLEGGKDTDRILSSESVSANQELQTAL